MPETPDGIVPSYDDDSVDLYEAASGFAGGDGDGIELEDMNDASQYVDVEDEESGREREGGGFWKFIGGQKFWATKGLFKINCSFTLALFLSLFCLIACILGLCFVVQNLYPIEVTILPDVAQKKHIHLTPSYVNVFLYETTKEPPANFTNCNMDIESNGKELSQYCPPFYNCNSVVESTVDRGEKLNMFCQFHTREVEENNYRAVVCADGFKQLPILVTGPVYGYYREIRGDLVELSWIYVSACLVIALICFLFVTGIVMSVESLNRHADILVLVFVVAFFMLDIFIPIADFFAYQSALPCVEETPFSFAFYVSGLVIMAFPFVLLLPLYVMIMIVVREMKKKIAKSSIPSTTDVGERRRTRAEIVFGTSLISVLLTVVVCLLALFIMTVCLFTLSSYGSKLWD